MESESSTINFLTTNELYLLIVIVCLSAIVLTYWTVDIHYFLRLAFVVFKSKFLKKRIHVLDTATVTGICLTTDIDYLITHMNNARFLRELDFARVDFYQRTGLYKAIQSKGGAVVQGAATIRYRKFIRVFSIYQIESKITYWDESSIYMEHRFISPGDNFVRAIVMCKQRLIKVNGDEIIRSLMSAEKCPGGIEAGGITKPHMPIDLKKWIEANEISSSNLRC